MAGIKDQHNRPLQDLRISITDRCNFRCTYCMPKEVFGRDFVFLPREELLTFEEIERIAKVFIRQGVRKIRLTGGEPLLRRDLHLLIAKLSVIPGLQDLSLTTNGVLLGKMADRLHDSGLQRVNVSLDALDVDVFQTMNGIGMEPGIILESIKRARDAGLKVKVNMVVKKGMNEQEILPMATHFKSESITLRFIEYMDVGESNQWTMADVFTKKEILTLLSNHFELSPITSSVYGEVAKRYRYSGTDVEVGFITSISETFCSSCTRARVSADGKLYTCLFAEEGLDLRELVRSEADDGKLQKVIRERWQSRNDRYSEERILKTEIQKKKIEMSYIGG